MALGAAKHLSLDNPAGLIWRAAVDGDNGAETERRQPQIHASSRLQRLVVQQPLT